MDGIINVLKPVGMTSADIVRWILKKTNARKAGHGGTLDPGAAGVLPVFLDKATRLVEYYVNQDKLYRAELTLGITTDTQDLYGQILETKTPNVSEQDFLAVLPRFVGAIEQTPPMYSAIKKKGKHLYEYARKGIEVVREKRPVTISELEVIEWKQAEFPTVLFDVTCSKGTYIRTLCHDIGQELGCGAHMSFLLRLRSGKFSIDSALTLEEIERFILNNDFSFVLNPEWGLDLPRINISAKRLKAFKNGLATNKRMLQGAFPTENTSVQVFCDGVFVGIGVWKDDSLFPNKVLC